MSHPGHHYLSRIGASQHIPTHTDSDRDYRYLSSTCALPLYYVVYLPFAQNRPYTALSLILYTHPTPHVNMYRCHDTTTNHKKITVPIFRPIIVYTTTAQHMLRFPVPLTAKRKPRNIHLTVQRAYCSGTRTSRKKFRPRAIPKLHLFAKSAKGR